MTTYKFFAHDTAHRRHTDYAAANTIEEAKEQFLHIWRKHNGIVIDEIWQETESGWVTVFKKETK